MIARAEAKYIRISPTKVRPVVPLVKNSTVKEALSRLMSVNTKGALLLLKVLKSAIANAKNKGYQEEGLSLERIVINPGPALKRYRAASFGRAAIIRKRTSHIIVELDTNEKLTGSSKK